MVMAMAIVRQRTTCSLSRSDLIATLSSAANQFGHGRKWI